MLKKKITSWKIDRKNKKEEILAALRICLNRRQQGKKTSFRIRGRVIDEDEIRRYLRRKGVRDLGAFAASNSEGDDSVLHPYTPPDSPALQHDQRRPLSGTLINDTIPEHLGIINHRDQSSLWPASPFETIASPPRYGWAHASCTPRLVRTAGGLNGLTVTEQLLYLNEAQFGILGKAVVGSTSELGAARLPVVRLASPQLKTFTNGMWRGRDLLLGGRSRDAGLCFNEAFGVVQSLLKQQDRKFLVELYEMILNFQLDQSKDILSNLLDYVDKMTTSNNNLYVSSWRIGQIGKCLKRMPVPERVENAECLLRNNLARQDAREPHDAQEAQSIEKTIARSMYRRKPMDQAIVYLTDLLSTASLEDEIASYEQCGLYVELAQLHRFLDQPEEAIQYLKLAWHKAFSMTEIYGCTDLRIRCLRTMGLIELKRGNYHLSAQFAREATDLANRYLGVEESLTSLVEAELAEVTLKMESLSLEVPSTTFDAEAAFRLPATMSAVASRREDASGRIIGI